MAEATAPTTGEVDDSTWISLSNPKSKTGVFLDAAQGFLDGGDYQRNRMRMNMSSAIDAQRASRGRWCFQWFQ